MGKIENEYRVGISEQASASTSPDHQQNVPSENDTDGVPPSNPHRMALYDGLPNYSRTDTNGIQSIIESASFGSLNLPITAYPRSEHVGQDLAQLELCRNIVDSFFLSITSKKDEAVATMIEANLVTANTTSQQGETPLLAAVRVGNVRMVQELLDFGADVDAFGATPSSNDVSRWESTNAYVAREVAKKALQRTPLMLAAAMGNINLVRLFVDVYHANDALIAPDGELALRLASDNGHGDIVQFLPSRRGGGWRRWKTKHAKAMSRTKRALKNIYVFFRVVLYDIPRFFVWSCPKHLIVLPIKHAVEYCWKHRKEFSGWCRRQAREMPGRICRGAAKVWRGMKKVPVTLWKGVKKIPETVEELTKWIWGIMKRIPEAVKVVALWLWGGIEAIAHGIGSIFSHFASFLHTVLSAIMSFFQKITLRDIWNGFCSVLHAIFVGLPLKMWSWVMRFEDMSYKVMKATFGFLGEIIWWIGNGIIWVVIYVPKKVWVIIESCGESIKKAWIELLVWINPKR